MVQRLGNIKKRREHSPTYEGANFIEIPEKFESFKFKGLGAKKNKKRGGRGKN